jgi:hypothetical protein
MPVTRSLELKYNARQASPKNAMEGQLRQTHTSPETVVRPAQMVVVRGTLQTQVVFTQPLGNVENAIILAKTVMPPQKMTVQNATTTPTCNQLLLQGGI